MARMTADGLEVQLCTGMTAVLMTGDRVELLNGYAGVVHQWTKRGVLVLIDAGVQPKCQLLHVGAFDVGDCEVQKVLRKAPPRDYQAAHHQRAEPDPFLPAALERPWAPEEIIRREA